MLLSSCWQFGDILLLSSNNRSWSFNWIRGSKHCFLTSFYNLNHYILFLVFLNNCYLLVSSRLSWLHRNPISHPIFLYLWFSEYHIVPHMTRFLEARCPWEPDTRISPGFLSPFHLSPKVSHAKRPLGDWESYLFHAKIFKLTFSCMT